ncbi:succinate receptor 1-like [Conger conger]|uniref:succinate receptor 1-like n=1 Tax=Conger conger TaxID=82655 RepID=UPI002A5A6B9D|nr:succinate receptor 1-like [Conger conger]
MMDNSTGPDNSTCLVNLLQWYYLPVMYSLEFCLGVPGNLLVILGYVFCLKEWKSSNVYLFNLAVSDLIFLFTLPRLAFTYARGQPETRPTLCILNRYILHVNLYSSILFMVWVSVDRYLLVRHPYRQHPLQKPRVAKAIVALTWVVVNAQVAPLIYFVVKDMDRGNWSRCSDFGNVAVLGCKDLLSYSLVLTATGYVLPLLALCAFSARIAGVLRAQAEVFQNRADPSPFRRPQRAVLATAAMFLVLYTPYHVMRNVYIARRVGPALPGASPATFTHDPYSASAYVISRPIAFAHSVVNPVFYFFMGDRFRELLMDKARSLFRRAVPQRSQSQGGECRTEEVH